MSLYIAAALQLSDDGRQLLPGIAAVDVLALAGLLPLEQLYPLSLNSHFFGSDFSSSCVMLV